MSSFFIALAFSLCALVSQVQANAESELVSKPHIQAGLASEFQAIAPGQPFWVALRLVPDDGWHTYWRNPGDTGLPTRIEWRLPQGSATGAIQWPIPERIDYQGLINYGYHGDTLLLSQITPPPDLSVGDSFAINATAKWLVCADVCIPGEADLSLTLPVEQLPSPSTWSTRFAEQLLALPQPLALDNAEFNLAADFTFQLPLGAERLQGAQKIQFFPMDAELVNNASIPVIEQAMDQLLVRVAKDKYLEQAPEHFNVLVTWQRAGETKAYEISARITDQQVAIATGAPTSLASYSLWSILLFALIGGVILNLMPCVFPVLSIKVISLIESGNHSSTHQKLHGTAYTLGVVLSFLVIAGVLLLIRAAGEGVGWGFQLQSPWFVAALVYLFFVLGMGMAGYVEIGASLTRAGNLMGNGKGLLSSFATGVLATVVATPCTAPFMGTAMGFAMTQSAVIALLVFGMLGFGLALPFLLLTFVPSLASRMPRPGKWMETLKEFLAFPLFLTMVWLLWVLTRQTDSSMMAMVLIGVVLLGFTLWLWRKAQQEERAPVKKTLATASVVAAISVLFTIKPTAEDSPQASAGPLNAMPYSAELLAEHIAARRPVFVNFTADWCITCKVNERVALKNSELLDAFEESDVAYLVGDWTNGSQSITTVLEGFGRNGVPLYLLYLPGKAEPQVLPQILTPGTIIEVLKNHDA